MTKEEFKQQWALHFPLTAPISYLFKHFYPERWFRIHSLPASKRYAENNAEWEILLARQNEIITDLLGADTSILLVKGEYQGDDHSSVHQTDEEAVFKPYTFTRLDNIDLHKLDPNQYDESTIYSPAFTTTVWKPNYQNKLLREIASDNVRAFFVSFEKNILVAPYDGGIDFVVKDTATKEFFKNKYRPWLSEREDGL